MKLGSTIQKIRKEKQLTQSEFSKKCGITQTYLSQIENDLKEPNLSTLKNIGEQLSLPLPILFFLALTEDDIQPDKRKGYDIIGPAVKSLVNEFFKV